MPGRKSAPTPPASPPLPGWFAPIKAWPRRQQGSAAAVLVLLLVGLSLFVWRASMNPLTLPIGASQCATLPTRDIGHLFGLTGSRDLPAGTTLRIEEIDTDGYTGAVPPSYWIVPVDPDGPGVGSQTTTQPPRHWDERQPATGASLDPGQPSDLVVELAPRTGHATLTGLSITYQTPDGFTHVASGDPRLEVDTSGACRLSTGPL